MTFSLSDVLCNILKVEYQQQRICAVKGSSAVMRCSFYTDIIVKTIQWGLQTNNNFKGHLYFNSKYINSSLRFQYIGDKRRDCSLKIHQVNHNDQGLYAIRFITGNKQSTWPVHIGPMLKVVGKFFSPLYYKHQLIHNLKSLKLNFTFSDLNIVMTKPHGNEKVKEGESVKLTCINSCDGTNVTSDFTWLKNGEPIKDGPVLNLRNISSTNSGNYTCLLKRHIGATSGVTNIDVECEYQTLDQYFKLNN